MKTLKTVLVIASLLVNALFLFVTVSAFTGTTAQAQISFYDMRNAGDGTTRYTTAAAVVSVPAEAGSVRYGPLELSLLKGEKAALQFSAVTGKKQANRLIAPLCDRKIVRIDETGFGMVITALEAGTTVLQTLAEQGIIDIAVITVTETRP
jgi:hypothetical protein